MGAITQQLRKLFISFSLEVQQYAIIFITNEVYKFIAIACILVSEAYQLNMNSSRLLLNCWEGGNFHRIRARNRKIHEPECNFKTIVDYFFLESIDKFTSNYAKSI